MESFRVLLHPKAEKELRRLPAEYQKKIFQRIKQLTENPFPKGVVKIKNRDHAYRIRVGVYRIIYEIDNNNAELMIFRIRHRKDAYMDL